MFFRKSLEDRVENAKGNNDEINSLIGEYKPFIASTVQKKTGRFLRYGHDDELAIGMMAFNEAIDSYDKDKGKFLSFAKHVINLRLIDYYRKHKKEENEVYINEADDEENDKMYNISNTKAIFQYKSNEENEVRRIEIIEYKKELETWGIEFNDLVKASPKHQKLRDIYKETAKFIINDKDTLDTLYNTKRLPIKNIQQAKDIHRKKLERGRIYIIALVIAFNGDYEFIREYIDGR